MLKNRFIVSCVAFLCCVSVFAQEDSRGKIALVANYHHGTCSPIHDRDLRNGENLPSCVCNYTAKETLTQQAMAHVVWASILTKNCLFDVVNRDNTDEMSKIFTEYSFYLDKHLKKHNTGKSASDMDKKRLKEWKDIKEKSISIGAEYIFIVDQFDYRVRDQKITSYRVKVIHTQSNMMIVFTIRPETSIPAGISLNSTGVSAEELKKIVQRQVKEIKEQVVSKLGESWFNTSWGLMSIKRGKKVRAGQTSMSPQPVGLKVYWYTGATDVVGGETYHYVNKRGESEIIKWSKEDGVTLRTEEKFEDSDIGVVWGKIGAIEDRSLTWPNYAQYTSSFIEIKQADNLSFFEIQQINTLIYDAFYESDFFLLIDVTEEDHIIAEELELQKSEEYLEGSTVSQTGAMNSQYGFYVNDLGSDKNRVKIELRCIDKATGEISKVFQIDEKLSDFKDKVIECLNSVMFHVCRVRMINKKELYVYNLNKSTLFKKFNYQLVSFDTMDVGGEETSIRIPLANLKLIETSGQKSRFKILEMLDKKKFKKIKESDELYIGANFD